MALFNPHSGQGSRSMLMMRLFTAQLLGLLACFANTALAQFDVSEAVTASASFPDVGITCIGNLAVFFSCLIRGRLHVEMGARDLLATITGSKLSELKEENGYVLTTCDETSSLDVVMLSNHTPESSMRQFMEYIKNTHEVDSTLLQFHRLSSGQVAAEICNSHTCSCIVIEGTDELIRFRLAYTMPGVLKQLPGSECLLPCLTCLRNGCHGCNHGMLHVAFDGLWTLTEGGPKEWPVPAVCEILDKVVTTVCEERSCICIPTVPAEDDAWTQMLIRSLKTKDKEDRGVTNPASDALGRYISQSGICDAREEYSTVPLIVPRLAEVLINIILTGWFRVDGFSSALVARRVIRDYIVDSRGTGIAANVFLKKCEVHSNAENTDVCQVLTFREIACIISGNAVVATLGIKDFGRWTYSAMQVLVWVKWGLGSYLLGVYSYDRYERLAPWAHDVSAGHGLMCASAFLLNAILAGVRGHWRYSQS